MKFFVCLGIDVILFCLFSNLVNSIKNNDLKLLSMVILVSLVIVGYKIIMHLIEIENKINKKKE